jgi:DNA-binding CsgD family transcriptional regulator
MATRVPLTQAEKQSIGHRKRANATLAQIAQALKCSGGTVRKW